MTDARFPERWLNDRRILRLPADDFRLFTFSLTWTVANRTDGRIYDDDLALIPGGDAGRPDRLVKAGLWERIADYWLITDFADTQTSRADLEVLDNARRRERAKKRRQRASRGTVPGDVPGDISGDSTRTGQARTGKDSTKERTGQEPADEDNWPDEYGVPLPPEPNDDGYEEPS
jgi:hypothetical protein